MACSLLSWSADNKCCLSISTCFCTKSNCLVFSVNRVSAMLVRLLSKSTSFRTLSETNCSQIWIFCRKLWEWWWAWKKKLISILFRSKSNAWIIRISYKRIKYGNSLFLTMFETKWICSWVEPTLLKLCWQKKQIQLFNTTVCFFFNRVSEILVQLLSKSTSFCTLSETHCSQIWIFCRKLWEWWWAWKKEINLNFIQK